MDLKENSFTKGGRNWKSVPDPSGSGNVGIYYEATPTEIERVKNKTYTTPQGNVSGQLYVAEFGEKQYVLHSSYVKQSDNNYVYLSYPPGQEVDNGNANQFIEIQKDKSIKTQVTETQSPNTSTTDPNQPNVPGGSTPANPNQGEVSEPQTGSGSLIYPEDLGSSGQDRIKFQALTYSASIDSRLPGLFEGGFALNRPTFTPVGGSVFLPIQSSITDQNSVGWEPDTMNPIEARAATISSSIMKASNPEDITRDVANNFLNALKDLKKEGEAVRAYLVGQAIAVNNLQSRLLGQVLNPNLELLFQGPQLRPFTFTFKLSPRSPNEAKVVKRIINYFKKNMAPIAEDNGLFLKTPNVFKIEYQKGTSAHKSINLIKECALTNCSVDYTPLGTYMTFNDEDATMVSYTLNLQFQELEPVYSRDYKDPNQIEF